MRIFYGTTSSILMAALVCSGAVASTKQASVGNNAPPFEIKLFNHGKRTLADYRGKVLVINYWATWCGPCKAEMPMMSNYHHRNQTRGFEIVGVITKDSAPAYQLKALAAVLSYPLALDLKGNYGVIGDAVPTNYVIDRKGVVRYAKATSFDLEDFRNVIEPLLDEPI